MLTELKVSNFALVDSLRIEFAPGLNVITGETGAGKSILLGAVELVLGGRGDKSLIRAGAGACQVDALFALDDTGPVNSLLRDAGLPGCEDGALLVRRQLSVSGPGRTLVNDAPATVHTLRKIGALLVDMHGPHDQQSLLSQDFQLDLLDAYGGLSGLVAPCAAHDGAIKSLLGEKRSLGDHAETALRQRDMLEYEVSEIEAAALTSGDDEQLVGRHAEAANSEQLLELGNAALDALAEGEVSAFSCLGQAQRQLKRMTGLLPDAGSWLAEAEAAAVQIQELARDLEARLSGMEVNPERLRELEERMALVQKLKRKYGATVDGILTRLDQSRRRLEELQGRDQRLAAIDRQISVERENLAAAARKLGRARRETAGRLAGHIQAELRDLGFARAGFAVSLARSEPGPRGADKVEFTFAPNLGEPERPLRAIASSGEISRVMLAIKRVLAAHDLVPVLIFDEIDANIGGEIGHVVGRKMRQVAASHQVLCITHLPQVAVHGAHHLVVSKQVRQRRTVTSIASLSGDGRCREIARMLGGDALTPVTREHAAAMLRTAAG